ncbi:hypothetical protein FKM82_028969 [Ascaphus truei]
MTLVHQEAQKNRTLWYNRKYHVSSLLCPWDSVTTTVGTVGEGILRPKITRRVALYRTPILTLDTCPRVKNPGSKGVLPSWIRLRAANLGRISGSPTQ